MKLIQRLGYYLGGFSVGLIVLAFFFNGKKTSFSYSPQARTLKSINSKTLVYNKAIVNLIDSKKLDSLTIKDILLNGDVDFSNSSPRKSPCGIYEIEHNEFILKVENCDSIATLLKATIKQ